MSLRGSILCLSALAISLSGCAREGDLVGGAGVGVTAVRSTCPATGVPDYTGDITLFSSETSKTVADLDVTAAITNVRSTCSETEGQIASQVTFDVLARRYNTNGARSVTLPYFTVVLRGGAAVQSKRVGTVTIAFADGEDRAQARGSAGAFIDKSAATLPQDVQDRITRKRKAGDPDAALDPLADPQVRAALRRASFEMLVGFQLTEDQLAYNVTR